jgi:DnaK suppressor protein
MNVEAKIKTNTSDLPEGYEPQLDLPNNYFPAEKEEYMCEKHLEFFRRKLWVWRAELIEESQQTIDHLKSEVRDVGDEAERATRETDNSLELRTRDRYRKLLKKLEQALRRVDDGEYGYCEETGDPIGLKRLEARPIATLSIAAQEKHEREEKQKRND